MPFTYTINTKCNFVTMYGMGVVTDKDYLDIVAQIYANPAYNTEMRSLGDLREVTDNQITLGTLEKVARESRFHPRARRAIIVGTKIDFQLAREHQAILWLHSKSRPRIFQLAKEAEDYLNEDMPSDLQIKIE